MVASACLVSVVLVAALRDGFDGGDCTRCDGAHACVRAAAAGSAQRATSRPCGRRSAASAGAGSARRLPTSAAAAPAASATSVAPFAQGSYRVILNVDVRSRAWASSRSPRRERRRLRRPGPAGARRLEGRDRPGLHGRGCAPAARRARAAANAALRGGVRARQDRRRGHVVRRPVLRRRTSVLVAEQEAHVDLGRGAAAAARTGRHTVVAFACRGLREAAANALGLYGSRKG